MRVRFSAVLLLAVLGSAAAQPLEEILTPKPGPKPAINGPRVYGVRPAHPFLYRIPCTGERPILFSATGLPATLKLDPESGIISGASPASLGNHAVILRATNRRGSATRPFKIVVGDTLALTPPMGWNHWYTHYDRINDAMFRAAADHMISSGMADFGYQYVNIDDCWMMKPGSTDPDLSAPPRDSAGAIQPNRRFPDMKALTAYIHAKGLKAGLYTSPGPLTCARYEGSYQHEEQDASTFAAWGFDFLKYDWCSYTKVAGGESLEDRKRPYSRMGAILAAMPRDIVFNLCQYGMGDVWRWGGEVGGQCWRTTGDLGLEKDTRLPGFYSIAFKNAQHAEYAAPGRWNDPDYILIGVIGNAHSINDAPKRTTLSAAEQYSYMSLWSLMAAPLFYSGDIAKLDDFTLNVLCNAEVIDVNQDTLGKQARVVRQTADELILARPLEDGSIAVGLFNLSESTRAMSDTAAAAGFRSGARVRDLWRQKNNGRASGALSAEVSRHGVHFVRISAR